MNIKKIIFFTKLIHKIKLCYIFLLFFSNYGFADYVENYSFTSDKGTWASYDSSITFNLIIHYHVSYLNTGTRKITVQSHLEEIDTFSSNETWSDQIDGFSTNVIYTWRGFSAKLTSS